jgi:hypothetical protein
LLVKALFFNFFNLRKMIHKFLFILRFYKNSSLRKLLIILIFISIQIITHSLFAIDVIVKSNIIDENLTYDKPVEIHITSNNKPFINGKVSLNNTDAWLFFDNIRPSVVIDSFTSDILIKGLPFNNGINGRIAIYGQGSVVMPHGNDFKPVIIYTGENFTGDSLQLEIHTYYNNLGKFDNSVKSFKLKRGYMATFATNADGTGYSRVFIADKEDIILNVMPAELSSTVSFIRVFKHQWVSKKGWCGWNANEIKKINVTCYYDWNVGGTTTLNYEYTPIRQKSDWPSWNDINSKQNVSHLLGFNEPDQTDQANMTLDQMLEQWPNMMKSGLRIGSPAWANPWGGKGGNLFDFIKKCDELNYRVDFIALHCYWGGKTPQNWYNDLKYLHEATGRPLWITEWNNGANWTTEWWPDNTHALSDVNAQKQLNDLKGILQVLDTAHFVERYFIYNWVQDCRAMILADTLTPAGKYYAANPSKIGYNSINDRIPKWNYFLPKVSCQYLNLSDKLRLDWTNPNGDLCKNYIIEKSINGATYDTIFKGNDINITNYLDTINRNISGTIYYKVSLLNLNGEYLKSNIISFYQIGGTDSIKFGKFLVGNTDWVTSLFNTQFTKNPMVFFGILSYNNSYPMAIRASNIKNNSFKFCSNTWPYLNNPQLSKIDTIAVLAINPGNYNFGGLKAEAKSVSSVSRTWKTVTFNEPFSTVPVVFCNIITNTNSIPLTLAVKNVTVNGFDLCLKSEEANTSFLLPESVNYFAIEPGKGIILNNPVTVGRSVEGSGIKSTPVEISYDSTYSKPILFAGLQTSMDNFAATLRYKIKSKSIFELYKVRESSYSVTPAKTDEFGWMIIDFSENQNTGLYSNSINSKFKIYPNPVSEILYFDYEKPVNIQIINMAGNVILKKEKIKFINISDLSSGVYILDIENQMPLKFIKK